MKNFKAKNINELKNNNKIQLIERLVQKNLKGGHGCPPPYINRSRNLAS